MHRTPPGPRHHAIDASRGFPAIGKRGSVCLFATVGMLAAFGCLAPTGARGQETGTTDMPTGIRMIPTDLPAHVSTARDPRQPVSLLPGTIPADRTIESDVEIPTLSQQYHQTLTGAARKRPVRATAPTRHQTTRPRQDRKSAPRSSGPVASQTARLSGTSTTGKKDAHLIQLGAFRDVITAETYWASFQIRYPDLAQSHPRYLMTANLGDKGIYHRLQLGGFASDRQAQEKCRQLLADGTDCFATRR